MKNKGREAHPVYVYNKNGSRNCEFKSEADFAKCFKISKNFLAIERRKINEEIVKIPNLELFASNKKIGRIKIIEFVKKTNCNFIKKRNDKDVAIGCFNLNNELIATFKGIFYLRALLNRNVKVHSTIPSHIKGNVYYLYFKDEK